jgi:hypothetical protein
MSDKAIRQDMERLVALPEFRRFLFRVIQNAGILSRITDGSNTRNLDYFEGRRNLGFDILDEAELGQAVPHEDALMTIFQSLREEIQKPPEEANRGRRSDRYDEIRPRDSRADPGPDSGADAG